MNFRQIILNSRTKEDKKAYFISEYEKIEGSRNAPDFFPKCFNIMEELKTEFHDSFNNKKQRLNSQINRAKDNSYNFYPPTSNEPFDKIDLTAYSKEQNLLMFNDLQEQFEKLSIFTYKSDDKLSHYGFLLVELTFIEMELLKAEDLITQVPSISDTNGLKKETSFTIDDNYMIDITKITSSYKKFNKVLFDIPFDDYLSVWNYNKKPSPIIYLDKQLAKFIYFLEQIPEITEKDALRFGIKNFHQRKNRHKPTPIFRNEVRTILKIAY